MDELKGLIRTLDADVNELRASVDRRSRVVVGCLVAVLVVLVGFGYVTYRDRQFRSCMSDWAGQYTDRSIALAGSPQSPGNARINLFFQAYTEAAGQIAAPLTGPQRQDVIAGLDKARDVFTLVPKHDKLEAATDYQILAYRDLIAALRAQREYLTVAAEHPVPSAPTCGGII